MSESADLRDVYKRLAGRYDIEHGLWVEKAIRHMKINMLMDEPFCDIANLLDELTGNAPIKKTVH